MFTAMKSDQNVTPKKEIKMPKGQNRPANKEEKPLRGHQIIQRVYENNWDVSTMNKLSKNCARWIVHELMRGQVGEQRYVSLIYPILVENIY